MTLQEYINEYNFYDQIVDVIVHTKADIAKAVYDLAEKERCALQKVVFENADMDVHMENANKGFFAKIGEKVIALMESVKKFFSGLLDRIVNIRGAFTSDADKANRILKENPELRDKIIMALDDGRITVTDLAGFERDALGLIRLFQTDRIDRDSFKGKFRTLMDRINDEDGTMKKVLKTTGTISSIIRDFKLILTGCGKMVESNRNLQKTLCEFKRSTQQENADPVKTRVIMDSLLEMIGFQAKEYKEKTDLLKRYGRILNTFVKCHK